MTTVFRVVISDDINQFDAKNYQDYVQKMTNQNNNYPANPPRFPIKDFPDWAKQIIATAQRDADGRVYTTKRAAKGKLTRVLRYNYSPCKLDGWVEEATEVVWRRV
jgi:hypothetical protein